MKVLNEMANWRVYLFALACVAITVLSAAIIYASWVEWLLKEPFYQILVKVFAMGVAIVGLFIGLLRIPKENIP